MGFVARWDYAESGLRAACASLEVKLNSSARWQVAQTPCKAYRPGRGAEINPNAARRIAS
jgi:hypothetical protein